MIHRVFHSDSQGAAARQVGAVSGVALLFFLCAACVGGPRPSQEYFQMVASSQEVEAQLAGEALSQRKATLRRMHRDMTHFHATMQGLQRHHNVEGVAVFESFVRPYMSEHLDSLMSNSSQPQHPELRPLEANLLLAKAALLLQMGDRSQVGRVIAKLSKNFGSMDSMLVEYPLGENATLEQSLSKLREQRRAL